MVDIYLFFIYLFNSLLLVSLQKVHTNEKYVKRCRHHNKPMLVITLSTFNFSNQSRGLSGIHWQQTI